MIQIRPVSDLRNKFSEIERIVNGGEPVCLTKNGRGCMVVLSTEEYYRLSDVTETALDMADMAAEIDRTRVSHEEGFEKLKEHL